MNPKTKKALIISGSVLGGVVITLIILYFAVMGIAILIAQNHHAANAALRDEGPWNGERAIWVSEDETLYLYVSGDPVTDGEVFGYIKNNKGEWEVCALQQQNYPGIRLTFRNGLILEADAKMKNGDLLLSEIEFATADLFPEWETLSVRKYSVEEKIGEYPVPPQLD